MATVNLDPYLFFTGNCREAMEFYKSVFGGELTVMTHDQIPGGAQPGMEGRVMHANLTGGVIGLMASDSDRASYDVSFVSLSLSSTDVKELETLFQALSDGATNVVPIKMESWGDMFGSLTDKFKVDWMFNGGGKAE